MAHAPLLRTNTAPVFPPNSNRIGGLQNSMNHAPRASQLSGSTAFAGSSTSLNSLSSAATVVPPAGGPVVATTNIINQKADASRSLYQICISLKQRLATVPNFELYLEQLDPFDPVEPLWELFKKGYPLLTIYNSLQPAEELTVDNQIGNEAKKSKQAIFLFLKACMRELNLPSSESFTIMDLMGNDTSGFVKVCSCQRPVSTRRPKYHATHAHLIIGNSSCDLCLGSRRATRPFAQSPTVPRR